MFESSSERLGMAKFWKASLLKYSRLQLDDKGPPLTFRHSPLLSGSIKRARRHLPAAEGAGWPQPLHNGALSLLPGPESRAHVPTETMCCSLVNQPHSPLSGRSLDSRQRPVKQLECLSIVGVLSLARALHLRLPWTPGWVLGAPLLPARRLL